MSVIARAAARPSVLDVFIAHAEARALLWQACEIDLHEAVDELQVAAERHERRRVAYGFLRLHAAA
jgi:hypothetical protein